jgi:hypothetical protein
LKGAIAGGIASEALARVGMLWRASRFLNVAAARACSWTPLARTATAAALAAAPAYGVRFLPVAGVSAIFVAAVIYSATYLVAMAALRRRESVPIIATAIAG